MINTIFQISLTIILAYLIGSIPTGYLIVKSKTGDDIRTIGSGSTGATNVKRVLGKKWFFIVLLLDALKGATPVILAKLFVTAFASIGQPRRRPRLRRPRRPLPCLCSRGIV